MSEVAEEQGTQIRDIFKGVNPNVGENQEDNKQGEKEQGSKESSEAGEPETTGTESTDTKGEGETSEKDNKKSSGESNSEISEITKALTELQRSNEILRSEIQSVKNSPQDEKKETEKEEIALIEFVSEKDFSEAMESNENLNSILNKVYQAAIDKAGEVSMRNLPSLIEKETTQQLISRTAVEEFWKANSDLHSYNDYVYTVYDQLYASNPTKPIHELLGMVADQVRTSLNIGKPESIQEKNKSKPRPRNAPGNQGAEKPDLKEDPSSEKDDMKRMLSVAGR